MIPWSSILAILAEVMKLIENGQLSQAQKQAALDAAVSALQTPVPPPS